MARRLGARCADCGTSYRSATAHHATATHRDRVWRRTHPAGSGLAQDRADWAHRQRLGSQSAYDAALEAEAMAGSADREPYWLGVLIASGAAVPADPGDGPAVIIETEVSAQRRTAEPRKARTDLAPCPRCGRADWRTADGRAYHVDKLTACATFARPERHVYVAMRG